MKCALFRHLFNFYLCDPICLQQPKQFYGDSEQVVFFLSLCSLRSTDVKNICSKEKVRQKANAILLLVTIPHFSFGRFYRSVEILSGFIRVILTLHTTNGSHPLFILVEKLFYWDLLGEKKKKNVSVPWSATIRHEETHKAIATMAKMRFIIETKYLSSNFQVHKSIFAKSWMWWVDNVRAWMGFFLFLCCELTITK